MPTAIFQISIQCQLLCSHRVHWIFWFSVRFYFSGSLAESQIHLKCSRSFVCVGGERKPFVSILIWLSQSPSAYFKWWHRIAPHTHHSNRNVLFIQSVFYWQNVLEIHVQQYIFIEWIAFILGCAWLCIRFVFFLLCNVCMHQAIGKQIRKSNMRDANECVPHKNANMNARAELNRKTNSIDALTKRVKRSHCNRLKWICVCGWRSEKHQNSQ